MGRRRALLSLPDTATTTDAGGPLRGRCARRTTVALDAHVASSDRSALDRAPAPGGGRLDRGVPLAGRPPVPPPAGAGPGRGRHTEPRPGDAAARRRPRPAAGLTAPGERLRSRGARARPGDKTLGKAYGRARATRPRPRALGGTRAKQIAHQTSARPARHPRRRGWPARTGRSPSARRLSPTRRCTAMARGRGRDRPALGGPLAEARAPSRRPLRATTAPRRRPLFAPGPRPCPAPSGAACARSTPDHRLGAPPGLAGGRHRPILAPTGSGCRPIGLAPDRA